MSSNWLLLKYFLPMHIIREKIVTAGKIKKELRSESNLATHHVLLLNPNLGQRIGSGRSSKIFSGFEKAEPIDK